jgi:hypothetical protein
MYDKYMIHIEVLWRDSLIFDPVGPASWMVPTGTGPGDSMEGKRKGFVGALRAFADQIERDMIAANEPAIGAPREGQGEDAT